MYGLYFNTEYEVEDDDIMVTSSEDDLMMTSSKKFQDRINTPWSQTLIMKLQERTDGYQALSTIIKDLWKPTLPIRIIDLENILPGKIFK